MSRSLYHSDAETWWRYRLVVTTTPFFLQTDIARSQGSYSALHPYASERYFTNHKVMSAVDKLHKLYSSTFEPIVWSRLVGLEVLNELDAVKAALMMDAGGGQFTKPGWEWSLLARGVEGIATGLSAARMLGGRIASTRFFG